MIKNILSTYEKASWQAINFQKSEIYFCKNTNQEVYDTIAALFGPGSILVFPLLSAEIRNSFSTTFVTGCAKKYITGMGSISLK